MGRSVRSPSRELGSNPVHQWIFILQEWKMTHRLCSGEKLRDTWNRTSTILGECPRSWIHWITTCPWWGHNQWVTIYADSKYTFGDRHAASVLWKEWEFITSAEKNISSGTKIWMLLEAIKLPREIALVHCPAHSKGSNEMERNNKITQTCSQIGLKRPEV